MGKDKHTLRIRVDAYTRLCLTVIAVLLTVLIVGLWADRPPLAEQAWAKGPFLESGSQIQLVQMVKAQDKTIAKLNELVGLFRSGQAKVQAQVVQIPAKPDVREVVKDVSTKTSN